MTSPPRYPSIFVSHSSKDDEFGRKLVGDLKAHLGDENVWYDAAGGLKPGDKWWDVIVERLSTCTVYLLVVSPAALDSEAVRTELAMAWDRKLNEGMRILPILYQHCELRLDLRALEYTSFLPPRDYEQAFSELITALRSLPGVEPGKVPETEILPAVDPPSAGQPTASQVAQERLLPDVMPTLLIFSITGLFSPRQVRFPGSSLKIGRGADNDLVLPDSSISRQHLRLEWTVYGWQITLQPNASETWLNGSVLEQKTGLRSGDQVVIGGTVLRFELPDLPLEQPGKAQADSPTLHILDIPPQLTVDCLECRFVVPLQAPSITLGRGRDNTLIVPSPVVATHHAVLHANVEGKYIRYSIEDLDSRNGLILNGQRIEPHRLYQLQSGDKLFIGSDTLGQSVTLTYTALR